MVLRLLVPLLMGVLLASTAFAADPTPLDAVAQRVADQFDRANPNRGKYSDWFSDTFLKSVPEAQIDALFQQLSSQNGAVERVLARPDNQKTTGIFDFQFSKAQMQVTLSIDAAPPHRVTGLFLAAPVPRLKSLEEVKTRLEKLHGSVSAKVMSLKDEKVLLEVNADKPLAIGSAFKLYILAEMIRQKKPWESVITLKEEMKSLPSGDLRTWPADSPLTLHTLAVKMISQSDNTAADMLLNAAGRGKVEASLAELGMTEPAKNVPFLSTLEAFKLKADPALAKEYLAGDAAARAKVLSTIASRPAPKVEAFAGEKPIDIERLEWFASASDLCRLMKWIDMANDPAALGILTINPGLPIPSKKFPLVGFKGGSETGVLNLTYLLRSAKGNHYALSMSWNDPGAAVDLMELAGLVLATVDMLE